MSVPVEAKVSVPVEAKVSVPVEAKVSVNKYVLSMSAIHCLKEDIRKHANGDKHVMRSGKLP